MKPRRKALWEKVERVVIALYHSWRLSGVMANQNFSAEAGDDAERLLLCYGHELS